MGNLSTLSRYQTGTLIDNLTYTYTGNQLQSINDATSSDLGLKDDTTAYTYNGSDKPSYNALSKRITDNYIQED
jgi:hypothetical protein